MCVTHNFLCRPFTYRDAIPGCNTHEFSERVVHLKKELTKLEEYENLLDRHRLNIEQSIKNVTEDIDTQRYLYVTEEDLVKCCGSDSTIFVINLPHAIDVTNQNNLLHLKSKSCPIITHVVLDLNEESSNRVKKRRYSGVRQYVRQVSQAPQLHI